MDTLLRGYSMQPRWTFPGMVMSFSGTFGGDGNRFPIPLGEDAPDMHWCLCDGTTTNGLPVPDLRGRMILGASDAHPAGSTGGSATHTHSLSGTVGETTLTVEQLATHLHSLGAYSGLKNDRGGEVGDLNVGTASFNSTDYAGGSRSHTHDMTGMSGEASSMPPYYALAYIMRCV